MPTLMFMLLVGVYAADMDLKIKILPGFRRLPENFPENPTGMGG
jgi:hypothetical protein